MRTSLLSTALSVASLALATAQLDSRAGGVCSSGIYGELVPLLNGYQPALAVCSALYPVKCVTAKARKRAVTTTPTVAQAKITSKTSTSGSSSTPSATVVKDLKASAWSKCQNQPVDIISTLCSCIETPKTCTTKTTTSRTTRSTTTRSNTRSTTRSSTTPSTTSTSTTTTTTTTAACSPSSSFYLLASGVDATIDQGRYALSSVTGDNDFVTFTPDITTANTFSINAAGQLLNSICNIANIDVGATQETVYFSTPETIASTPGVAATCSIASGTLQCTDQTATILYVCTDLLQLQIGATVPQDNGSSGACYAITLTVVPA